MAGLFAGPPRGGTRGGRDQFKWDDVKEDKYYQNFLGHTAMAPIGRWQKGKDLTWYGKKSKVDLKKMQEQERDLVKRREQELFAQAMGEKPMEVPKAEMDKIEKNKLFKKGNAEEGTVQEALNSEGFGERIEGLGYAPIKIDNMSEMLDTTTHERQEGYVNDLLKQHATGGDDVPPPPPGGDDVDYAALLAGIGDGDAAGDGPTSEKDKKKMKKELKKQKKEAKKAEKKAKKEAKDSKRKRKDSDSDSDSPDPRDRREPDRGSRDYDRGGRDGRDRDHRQDRDHSRRDYERDRGFEGRDRDRNRDDRDRREYDRRDRRDRGSDSDDDRDSKRYRRD